MHVWVFRRELCWSYGMGEATEIVEGLSRWSFVFGVVDDWIFFLHVLVVDGFAWALLWVDHRCYGFCSQWMSRVCYGCFCCLGLFSKSSLSCIIPNTFLILEKKQFLFTILKTFYQCFLEHFLEIATKQHYYSCFNKSKMLKQYSL